MFDDANGVVFSHVVARYFDYEKFTSLDLGRSPNRVPNIKVRSDGITWFIDDIGEA